MIPLLTPDEARALDAGADVPVEVLIGRAGAAVAGEAVDLLGGAYGRRVVVIAGKGNNGNDGRVAAAALRRRGARVEVVDPGTAVPPCDLVIDAAYGTGFRGRWEVPEVDAPVLAVDIPSGLDALTGEGASLRALRTVSFVGAKPGLLLAADRAGEIVVADIGLDGSGAAAQLVEDADVRLPRRPLDTHKWKAAVWVLAGSPGMTGAARLAARGAQRAGASYVRLSTPGGTGDGPVEVVHAPLDPTDVARFGCMVVGPGLGRGSDEEVRALVGSGEVPVVVDGDGLTALGPHPVVPATTVLTPHDGEYERLTGRRPGSDRLDAARSLASSSGGVVLLKGPTTVVAQPDGQVLVAAAGDARLATAGTGDVLSGIIGAFVARGVEPFTAAAWAAHVHGCAALLGRREGFVAGDLPELVPQVLDALTVG